MSESAGEFVNRTDRMFRAINTRTVDVALERLGNLEEYLEGQVLDEDIVHVFNRGRENLSALVAARAALLQRTPENDYLHIFNGYTAIASRSGIIAMHSAAFHEEAGKSISADPVAKQHGVYAYMGIVKAARGLVMDSFGRYCDRKLSVREFCLRHEMIAEPWTLGIATAGLYTVGVTGGLLREGGDDRPIRREVMSALSDAPQPEHGIDILAGLADQLRAEHTGLALVSPRVAGPLAVETVIERAKIYLEEDQNLH